MNQPFIKQKVLLAHSPDTNIMILPAKKEIINTDVNAMQNRNILDISEHGRMAWQKTVVMDSVIILSEEFKYIK